MICMRKLTYEYKLPSRSLPEVQERFKESLLSYQKRRSILFNGRAITAEAYANAVMLHFLDLDEPQQRAILTDYVRRFEVMTSLPEGEAEPPGAASQSEQVKVPKGRGRKTG